MAINYERVNWDSTMYVNPTNMNQMDKGIKDACDQVDINTGELTEIAEEISAINTNLGNKSSASAVSGNDAFSKINSLYENQKPKLYTGATLKNSSGEIRVCETGNTVVVTIECTPISVSHNTVIVEGLPTPFTNYCYLHLPTNTGAGYSAMLGEDGKIIFYYPSFSLIERIDCTFSYIKA